jgi:hypothetical protein
LSFDGRIQLNGDEAPELEVIVRLDDQFVVLGHSSGELGRWDKSTVHVAPIGRGWFTLDVEDETVTFLPRRPGYFAASTVDLLPVEPVEKKWWQRRGEKQAKKAEPPPLSRKERKRLEREQASQAPAAPPVPAIDQGPTAATVESVPDTELTELPSSPAGQAAPAPVDSPAGAETPDAALGAPATGTSPWDDVPVPEIPEEKSRHKKPRKGKPESPPRPARAKKPPREKAPKQPKASRGTAVPSGKAARPAAVAPAGPKEKSAFSKGLAGFRHGVRGMAWRISDELRQSGIVPFDRLPAAPARKKPGDDHKHDFQEHRLPGGLTRNVCHSCGLVSIGEQSGSD